MITKDIVNEFVRDERSKSLVLPFDEANAIMENALVDGDMHGFLLGAMETFLQQMVEEGAPYGGLMTLMFGGDADMSDTRRSVELLLPAFIRCKRDGVELSEQEIKNVLLNEYGRTEGNNGASVQEAEDGGNGTGDGNVEAEKDVGRTDGGNKAVRALKLVARGVLIGCAFLLLIPAAIIAWLYEKL